MTSIKPMLLIIILITYVFFRFGIATVDECNECDDRFVNVAGDNMTGALWLPNFRVFNANSEENSTLVGNGADHWKVGVWDGGYGIGSTINLRATQSALITFGNMTEIEPKLIFAPNNLTAYQRPIYIFTAFNESGTGDGAFLYLIGDKENLKFTWWLIGAKKLAYLGDSDYTIDYSFGLFRTLRFSYTSPDMEIYTTHSFSGSNISLSFRPEQHILLRPNSGFVCSYASIIPDTNVTRDLGTANLAWRNLYVQTVYEGSAGAVNAGVDDFMNLDLDNKDTEALKESFPEEIKDTYLIREYNQKIAFNETHYEEVPWNYLPKPYEQITIERRREIVPNDYVSKASLGEDEIITQETFLDVFSELRFTQKVLQQVMAETCMRDHSYSWCS